MCGRASDHLSWLKKTSVLPPAVLHNPPWDHGIVFALRLGTLPQHRVEIIAFIAATPLRLTCLEEEEFTLCVYLV
jgi:hypothetical protein